MSNSIIDKKIEKLLAIGQLLISEATGLKNGQSVATGLSTRKGLDDYQKTKLIAKRFKTAFKQK
ncbi:MAG TPA: hypothetical protein VF487_20205 [Chitinophagaceae bacterium]